MNISRGLSENRLRGCLCSLCVKTFEHHSFYRYIRRYESGRFYGYLLSRLLFIFNVKCILSNFSGARA
jgi:hypothetical protein